MVPHIHRDGHRIIWNSKLKIRNYNLMKENDTTEVRKQYYSLRACKQKVNFNISPLTDETGSVPMESK